MTKPVIIRKIGNSLGVVLSDYVKEMGLQEGDKLFVVRTPHGIELQPYDPDVARAIEAGREFMRLYPNAMKALASS